MFPSCERCPERGIYACDSDSHTQNYCPGHFREHMKSHGYSDEDVDCEIADIELWRKSELESR
jgi:hypothetical protein